MSDLVEPTVDDVKKLLAMMYGDDLSVEEDVVEEFKGRHIATFLDDDDDLVAVCACDLDLVAYSGAALSMVPTDNAKEMVSNKEVTEMVAANFYEVMNICSRLLMSDTSPHLRLDKALNPADGQEPLKEIQECYPTVLGFRIDIPGYGSGHMAVLLAG